MSARWPADRSQDTAYVTPQQPGVEPLPRAPHPGTDAPGHAASQLEGAQRSWRLLGSILRLQTFAALHHREFRLLWAGQAATAMARLMDQVVRG